MKIRVGEDVYLQKFDIAFLLHSGADLPAGLLSSMFISQSNPYTPAMFIMSGEPKDACAFDTLVDNPVAAKWVMEQSFLIDFADYAEQDPDNVSELVHELDRKLLFEIVKFNESPHAFRKEHIDEYEKKFVRARHQVDSLEWMEKYLRKQVKFTFPTGYKPPKPPRHSLWYHLKHFFTTSLASAW